MQGAELFPELRIFVNENHDAPVIELRSACVAFVP